jgi:hypothetical protein
MNHAYSSAVAFESAGDLPRDPRTKEYVLTDDILEYYARVVAYKTAYNLKNGLIMDPGQDPLDYVDDCGDIGCLDSGDDE